MTEILNRCNSLVEKSPNCEHLEHFTTCIDCVQDGFYKTDCDTYDCLNKLALYTINYGPVYVSEIYHFLNKSELLDIIFKEKKEDNPDAEFIDINVKSLGCGFAPDDIALNKYRDDNQLNELNFNYYGVDIEPYWNLITDSNAVPITYDVLKGIDFENIDLIFLNKIYTTLRNHGLEDSFFDVLENAIDTMSEGSYLIFNDINNNKMGRDKFHKFAINHDLSLVKKYYFNIPGAYTGDYTPINDTHNICVIPNGLVHTPRSGVTKTVIFLYQK